MKNNLLSILFIFTMMIMSCSKSSLTNGTSSTNSQLKTAAQNGVWHISYYLDKTDQTSKFNGYTFGFDPLGSVIATKGSNSINGTWSTGNDDSDVKIVLDFGGVSPFSEIEEDWHAISISDNEMKLIDVSGGNGGTDYLTFNK